MSERKLCTGRLGEHVVFESFDLCNDLNIHFDEGISIFKWCHLRLFEEECQIIGNVPGFPGVLKLFLPYSHGLPSRRPSITARSK